MRHLLFLLSLLIEFLEKRPSRGWLTSFLFGVTAVVSSVAADGTHALVPDSVGVLPPVPENLAAWIAIIGGTFATLGAMLTSMIQLRTWWRGRRQPPAPPPLPPPPQA